MFIFTSAVWASRWNSPVFVKVAKRLKELLKTGNCRTTVHLFTVTLLKRNIPNSHIATTTTQLICLWSQWKREKNMPKWSDPNMTLVITSNIWKVYMNVHVAIKVWQRKGTDSHTGESKTMRWAIISWNITGRSCPNAGTQSSVLTKILW